MQRAEQKFFTDRAIFYTSSKLYEQGQKGKQNWDFELKEVYFIALMDFNFDSTLSENTCTGAAGQRRKPGKPLQQTGVYILELPSFNIGEKIKTIWSVGCMCCAIWREWRKFL